MCVLQGRQKLLCVLQTDWNWIEIVRPNDHYNHKLRNDYFVFATNKEKDWQKRLWGRMLFESQEARDSPRGIPVELLMRHPFPMGRPELTSCPPRAAQTHPRANQDTPSGARARGHTRTWSIQTARDWRLHRDGALGNDGPFCWEDPVSWNLSRALCQKCKWRSVCFSYLHELAPQLTWLATINWNHV